MASTLPEPASEHRDAADGLALLSADDAVEDANPALDHLSVRLPAREPRHAAKRTAHAAHAHAARRRVVRRGGCKPDDAVSRIRHGQPAAVDVVRAIAEPLVVRDLDLGTLRRRLPVELSDSILSHSE